MRLRTERFVLLDLPGRCMAWRCGHGVVDMALWTCLAVAWRGVLATARTVCLSTRLYTWQ